MAYTLFFLYEQFYKNTSLKIGAVYNGENNDIWKFKNNQALAPICMVITKKSV